MVVVVEVVLNADVCSALLKEMTCDIDVPLLYCDFEAVSNTLGKLAKIMSVPHRCWVGRIGQVHFQATTYSIRLPNLTFVFVIISVIVSFGSLMHVWFYSTMFSFLSAPY